MITGNKGEWSEIYALFKLLGDKQLFLGNKEIEKLEGLVYPIIKILRTENNGNFEYSIKDEIILVSGDEEVLKIRRKFNNLQLSVEFPEIKELFEKLFGDGEEESGEEKGGEEDCSEEASCQENC